VINNFGAETSYIFELLKKQTGFRNNFPRKKCLVFWMLTVFSIVREQNHEIKSAWYGITQTLLAVCAQCLVRIPYRINISI
jgi:hypothetical protein